MDGLVIWSEPESKKAIIWCQDHGHLAWLEGWPAQRFAASFPDVGDLLAVEVAEAEAIRPVIQATMKKAGFDPRVAQRLFEAVSSGELNTDAPVPAKSASGA